MQLNRKGFTLVEVLAVIIILSMLMAITIPNVNTLINEQKNRALENIEKSIISAAKIYMSDNKYDLTFDTNPCTNDPSTTVSVGELINKGYIKQKKIKNPNNNTQILRPNKNIEIKYSCNKKILYLGDFNIDPNDDWINDNN